MRVTDACHDEHNGATQTTLRVLPQAIQAGEAVAEALLRPMSEDGLRAHSHGTLTRSGPGTKVSQTVKTETRDTMTGSWWLEPISPGLRDKAVASAEAGDAIGFLCTASNDYGMWLVFYNTHHLKRIGVYERALLHAFQMSRVNHHSFGLTNVRRMFDRADRMRLREAGNALPGSGPFTLYRGVGGNGRARHVRGLSWTASLEKAKWFANRAAWFHLSKPAVYRTVANESDVLAYINGREEQEFVVLLPRTNKPERVWSPCD